MYISGHPGAWLPCHQTRASQVDMITLEQFNGARDGSLDRGGREFGEQL